MGQLSVGLAYGDEHLGASRCAGVKDRFGGRCSDRDAPHKHRIGPTVVAGLQQRDRCGLAVLANLASGRVGLELGRQFASVEHQHCGRETAANAAMPDR